MNSQFEGPLLGAFEADTTGVVKQEFITYRKRDGMFVKETTSRRFIFPMRHIPRGVVNNAANNTKPIIWKLTYGSA